MLLPGISNENEFYSDHYLSELFSQETRSVIQVWNEREAKEREESRVRGESAQQYRGYRTPPNRLTRFAGEYTQLLQDAERDRDPHRQVEKYRELTRELCNIFDLPFEPRRFSIEDDVELPLIGALQTQRGEPYLWILEALPPEGEVNEDPLASTIWPEQLTTFDKRPVSKDVSSATAADWQKRLSQQIFSAPEPPRWVLLVGPRQWLLLDRAKFARHRLLRFDWVELFTRREKNTLDAVSVLLHKTSLFEEDGQALLDTIDENAHKHAYGVSEDLKYALREAIELLGNEAAKQLEERARGRKKSIYSGTDKLDPAQLSTEALRYMYRILFLFYIESRPDLGYAPVDNATYVSGYSLEHLRDLELIPLTSEAARNGYYIHESLERLFSLINEGYLIDETDSEQATQTGRDAFSMRPLKSHLFDPERTKLLKHVKFPNHVLQRIIELMSLSRPAKGRRRRGRISYAQLGINQLGAVYEALLSYRGFFAETDLYEVKEANKPHDPLGVGYFVQAEALEHYTDEQKVYEKDEVGNKRLVVHPKGSFIYRLAGRDRETSASYYTPEVLTQATVKYALEELYKEQLDPLPNDAARARHLLNIKVLEPAMGSAAFLNEAVNQLADKYLELYQSATGERIPQAEFTSNLQRVKMYFADNAVFGIDLNPVAEELAEVSLWLNALSEDRFIPWFGLQLHNGNSLIGARREVYQTEQLVRGAKNSWLKEAPARLTFAEAPKPGQIWHFLLPDNGMANYSDKDIRKYYPEEIKAMNAWRREFTKPFSSQEIHRLEKLSERVEELWQDHAKSLGDMRKRTSDPHDIPGYESTGEKTPLSYKDQVKNQELLAEKLESASAYRRLKLVMDYWCALWFWPITKADVLPRREQWLQELEHIVLADEIDTSYIGDQTLLFPETNKEEGKAFVSRFGAVNLKRLFSAFPRLRNTQDITDKYRFFHWEVEFADIYKSQGGFDLVLGNPPWVKLEWNSGAIISDHEPRYILQRLTAPELSLLQTDAFEAHAELKGIWREAFEEISATQAFLSAEVNFPELVGITTNLYKCFLPRVWKGINPLGVVGLLHPEGVFDDPDGGQLRAAIYLRLRAHFQFVNELKLFSEPHHNLTFSINIYGPGLLSPRFITIANLFDPITIERSFLDRSSGIVPGLKNEEISADGRYQSTWALAGHADRIVPIGVEELRIFANLYDREGTKDIEARLPALHSVQILQLLRRFAKYPLKMAHIQEQYFSTTMWNETIDERRGVFSKQVHFPQKLRDLILSGPHLYSSSPLYKTPRRVSIKNSDYDSLDLTLLNDDYLPRSKFKPKLSWEAYRAAAPKVPWIKHNSPEAASVLSFPRLVYRSMLSIGGDRTLITALFPREIGHIHGLRSYVFQNNEDLLTALIAHSSLPFDFLVKSTGKQNLHKMLEDFPFPKTLSRRTAAVVRALALNCITFHYSEIWEQSWSEEFKQQSWSTDRFGDGGSLQALPAQFFRNLTPTWSRNSALRGQFSRRQASLELDVLVALELGLQLDELLMAYRVQFPILRQNEAETFYDQNGRIIFTIDRGLIGVGLPRRVRRSDLKNNISYGIHTAERHERGLSLGWEDIKDLKSGIVTKTFMDDTIPDGPVERTVEYVAPFFRPDREEDYRRAWKFFEEKYG